MTCIVGIVEDGNVFLGGDSAATDSSGKIIIIKEPKVWVDANMAFGVCGTPLIINLMQSSFKPQRYAGENPDKFLVNKIVPSLRECFKKGKALNKRGHFYGGILIGCGGKLFNMESNFQIITNSLPYDTVGSGSEIAVGSLTSTYQSNLNATERIELALNCAAKHNTTVAPPFTIVQV